MTALLAAVRSEVTKILTLRSLLVCCAALLVLHAGIQAISLSLYADAVAGIDDRGLIEDITGTRVPAVPEVSEQLVAAVFQVVPLLPVAGALVAGSEFRTGQIGLSVMATPSRARLVAATAIAMALLTVALCVVLALVTTAFMIPAVAGWNPAVLVSPGVLGGYLRITAVAVCTTLTAWGIALVARRALAGVLVWALVLTATITQAVAALSPAVDAALPLSAARNLLFSDSRDVVPPLTSGPWTAAVVLTAWAVVAVAASVAVVGRRDAR